MPRSSDQPNAIPRVAFPGTARKKCGPISNLSLLKLAPLLTLSLIAFSGCYTYAETSLTELTPGLHARVTLDEDGFGRVVNQVASNGVTVDVLDPTRRGFVGRLTATGPSNMTMELRAGGGSVFAANFATQSVQEISVRTFSRKRTIGAVAAGVVLFAAAWRGTMGGTTSPNAPPEPEQLVAPVTSGFRIATHVAIANVVEALARLGSSR